MQPVYIDKLFLVNAAIDYIILLSTAILLKRDINIKRIILSAVFGGLYSVFAHLLGGSIYTSIVFGLIVLVICSFIAFGNMKIKKSLITVLTLFIINFVFVGAISAIYKGSSRFFAVSGGYYTNISMSMFVCIFAITYLVMFVVYKIFIKK